MKEHPAADRTDARLNREIEMALDVEPSPEFLARIRAGIASAPAHGGFRGSWAFAGGAVLAVIIALVMTRARTSSPDLDVRPSTAPPQAQALVEESRSSLPPVAHSDVRSPARQAAARPSRSASAATEVARAEAGPEVLISAEEAALVRRLLTQPRRSGVDLSSLPDLPEATVALSAPSEISIAPIEFAPVTAATPGEGERQ